MTNDALKALEEMYAVLNDSDRWCTHMRTIRAALAPVDVDAIHKDGFDEGFESGKLEATEFDRDLRRAVFGFLEKRGQIENGEEYTAQDIMDCLVAYEHYLINTNKAPKPVDVEGLANYIRAINGDNTMGAGELAEKITDHLAARGCLGVPEGYVLVPIDLLHKAKVLINFHVKRGACIDINDKLFNEGEIYSELNKLWAQAWAKDAPKKEGRNE